MSPEPDPPERQETGPVMQATTVAAILDALLERQVTEAESITDPGEPVDGMVHGPDCQPSRWPLAPLSLRHHVFLDGRQQAWVHLLPHGAGQDLPQRHRHLSRQLAGCYADPDAPAAGDPPAWTALPGDHGTTDGLEPVQDRVMLAGLPGQDSFYQAGDYHLHPSMGENSLTVTPQPTPFSRTSDAITESKEPCYHDERVPSTPQEIAP
jgi:hypothetical protein